MIVHTQTLLVGPLAWAAPLFAGCLALLMLCAVFKTFEAGLDCMLSLLDGSVSEFLDDLFMLVMLGTVACVYGFTAIVLWSL